MATLNDHKNAQKVIAANELARAISDLDPERFAAAMTLLTPSEIDRLASIAHVAAMLAPAGAVVEPRPRKKRAAKDPSPGPAAGAAPPATEAAGPGKDVAMPKCEAPECPRQGVYPTDVGHFCGMHCDVEESIRREWHTAFKKARARSKAKAIREGIEEPGKASDAA